MKCEKSYAELKSKFDLDVAELQNNCKHEKLSDWIEHWWAVGHSSGCEVRFCENCNKMIENRKKTKVKK